MQKVKYVTNKELLKEIHNSKKTFCYYKDASFSDYHVIIQNKDQITPELVETLIAAKAKPRGKALPVILGREDLVFRVMTHEHIPLDPDRKRKARNTDQSYARTNFPPFKHYVLRGEEIVEVARSHWKGDIETGEFFLEKGRINNNLALMFMLLVDRISRRGNWRSYSYVDEMRCHALAQLSQMGLLFDESKSDNPFAFYTTAVNNSFTRILNLERRSQNIRDDMLIMAGSAPSYTRQIDHELEYRFPTAAVVKKPATRKPVLQAAAVKIKED